MTSQIKESLSEPLEQVPIVFGPGHSLNELVSKMIWSCSINTGNATNGWELYPGVFGLYTRHSDDWVASVNVHTREIDATELNYYNKTVRSSTDPSVINDYYSYRNEVFYTNIDFETQETIIGDIQAPVVCSYLDMENYPESRFHFAMMEFSDGAAEMLSYDHIPSYTEVALRCRVKHEVELQYREKMPQLIWVNVGEILNKNYTSLFPIIGNNRYKPILDAVVDQYNWYNRIAHPIMHQLVNADWQEIMEILVDNN